MRLEAVDRARPTRMRVALGLSRLLTLSGLDRLGEVPDIVKVGHYRKDFFGTPGFKAAHMIMRGPSDWSVGERELFAAFVSSLNQCPF
jgi:hypothetical protein